MKHTQFLQSSEWADFQTTVGHTSVRMGDTYAYTHRTGPFRYAYIPRAEVSDDTIVMLYAKGIHWVRIEGEVTTSFHSVLTHARQPQTTLLLDLTQTEEALLAAMHSKTRYNIRLAERKGVTILREKNSDVFWQLHSETTERDGFFGHPRSYYEKFIAMDMCEQFTAYYEGVPIAVLLCIRFGDTMTYVHGASSNTHRTVMAPYLLQWEAMRYARSMEVQYYDVWGVAPILPEGEAKNETCYNGYCWDVTHPWTGITRFKVGFGGTVVQYPEAQDVILRPFWYRCYQFLHALRYGKI